MPKSNARKILYILAIFLITTFILCYPLFFKGYYIYGHDSGCHVLWAQQFLKSVNTGLLYPQWVTDVNLGCGNATFIFYPPFIFFSYAVINLFINEILAILNISVFLGMLASGITMYIFCRIYMTRLNSLFSSIAYMALPYHLVDLYIRTALAEFWAFAWIPLVCFFTVKIKVKVIPYLIGLSISYAGLVLTHVPTALLFSPFLIAYIIFLFYQEDNRKLSLYRVSALGIGLCLSSFYLIPAVAEQQYVNIDALTRDKWYWIENNFLFSRNAGSLVLNRGLSQIAISTSLIAAVSLIVWIFRRDKDKNLSSPKSFFAISGIVSFFLMLSISKIIWESVPFLKQVQFPWRLLSITTFFASLSLGFLFENLFHYLPNKKRAKTVLLGLCISALIVLNGWYSNTIMNLFESFSSEYVQALKKQNFRIRSDSSYDELLKNYNFYYPPNPWLIDVHEYRPLWSVYKVTDNISSISAALEIPPEILNEQVIFKRGSGKLAITKWEPENRLIQVQTTEPSHILVKTFYYPRWKAYIRGKPIPVTPDPCTGLITVKTPQGEYTITLRFEASTYRLIGKIISIISAGTIFLFLGNLIITRRII